MFKVNNKGTRTMPYFAPCSSVSVVNFIHVITGWVQSFLQRCLDQSNAQISYMAQLG